MLCEITLQDLPLPITRWRWPLDAERYIVDVHQAIIKQKQAAVFPARLRVTPVLYLPRPARLEDARQIIAVFQSSLEGYIIAANDAAHIEEGGPIVVELRPGVTPRMDAIVTPIAPLLGDLP
ncbi:MAG: hypothetical protein ACM3ZC_13395 [Bacteroidota bacterium]